MNEQDLRDCFAMFAMMGIIARGSLHPDLLPVDGVARRAYEQADEMLEARKPKSEIGLPAIKRRKKSD